MNYPIDQGLTEFLIELSKKAGSAIMEVYEKAYEFNK